MPTFLPPKTHGLAARYEAQKLAFAPVVFQCVRIAWKSGLLALLDAAENGLTVAELAHGQSLSEYAVRVVMESALAAGVVSLERERYRLSKVGNYLVHDRMTQINFDFVQDICYQGLFELEASLKQEKPLGLKHLGDWPTIYEGLSSLPEPARSSWFDFDHYYSDSAFRQALPKVLRHRPRRVMDIGANTGKWSRACLEADADLHLTLVDLPQQLELARLHLEQAGLSERAAFRPVNMLDETAAFPAEMDAIWMSQFLTCFGETTVRSILLRARASLAAGGRVFILDTFWDRQAHDIAAYCIINTSPYFTAMASGNSKMYESAPIVAWAEAAGLRLSETHDELGISHSLLVFEARP